MLPYEDKQDFMQQHEKYKRSSTI